MLWEGRHCCRRTAIAVVTERAGSHPRGLPVLRQRPEGRMLGYVDGIRESPVPKSTRVYGVSRALTVNPCRFGNA